MGVNENSCNAMTIFPQDIEKLTCRGAIKIAP